MKPVNQAARFAVLLSLGLLILSVGRVLGHGIGTPQQLNVPSGPYLLSIWTDPEPLRVNNTHVTVAVMNSETREPILTGVQVTVQLQPQPSVDPSTGRTAMASPDDTVNKLFYAAIFDDLPAPGLWQATVLVSGPAGPGEEVLFEVEVLPPQPFNWLWPGLIGLSVVAVGWLMRSWRKKPPQKRPLKRRTAPPHSA